MLNDPLILIAAAAFLGLLAVPVFTRFVSSTALTLLALFGPVLLFLLIPIVGSIAGTAKVLGAEIPALLLCGGAALCASATYAGMRRDSRFG